MFGKLSRMSITTHSLGSFPVTNCQVTGSSTSKFKFILSAKRYFTPSASNHTDLITPPIGVRYPVDSVVHASPGNCSPAYNSSASVIIASCSKCMKCHTSGYINLYSLWSQVIHILSFNKSRAEEVPVIGMKTFTLLRSLPEAEELYFICFDTSQQR